MESLALDCGHVAIRSGVGTGVAYTPDGKSLCYQCADALQQARFNAGEGHSAYLAEENGRYHLRTWSGGYLAEVKVTRRKVGYTPTGGHYERYHFRAVTPNGRRYHGTSPGPGMYAQVRPSVRQRLVP
jgi:hypothetical protein